MAWRIEVSDQAKRELARLGRPEAARITGFLRERIAGEASPRRIGEALQGARFKGLWRYRVGDWRVIVDIRDQVLVVLVLEIGHRREVYRD